MTEQLDSTGIKSARVTTLTLFSISKGNPTGEACKRLETALSDEKKLHVDKVGLLMTFMEHLLTDYLTRISAEDTLLLFQFLRRHALKLIMHGDWCNSRAAVLHITVMFRRLEERAKRKGLLGAVEDIRYLLKLTENPWGDHTLENILIGENCSDEDILSFLKAEMGVVMVVRIETMIKERCYEEVSRLIEVCLQCVSNPANSEHFQPFAEEISYIRDLYLFVLGKTKNNCKLLNELNKIGLSESLKFYHRCFKNDWVLFTQKCCRKMAEVVANISLISAIVNPVAEEQTVEELMQEWFNLYPDTQVLLCRIKNMVQYTLFSQYIYVFGKLLVTKYGIEEKSFCVEMYIRALTLNLNELERHKSDNDENKVKESELQLSNGFLLLADYLIEHVLTCRELVLTAFSLNPTPSCLDRIKVLAVESGMLYNGHHESCELGVTAEGIDIDEPHGPVKEMVCSDFGGLPVPEQEYEDAPLLTAGAVIVNNGQLNVNHKLTHLLKSHVTQYNINKELIQSFQCQSAERSAKNLHRVENTKRTDQETIVKSEEPVESRFKTLSTHAYDEQEMGIPQHLCDDLSILVSSARYQALHWDLEWAELTSRCKYYLTTGKVNRSIEKKMELLTIDCNKRSDTMGDEMCSDGIEKGFGSYITDTNNGQMEISPKCLKRKRSTKRNLDEQHNKCTQNMNSVETELYGTYVMRKSTGLKCKLKAVKKS